MVLQRRFRPKIFGLFPRLAHPRDRVGDRLENVNSLVAGDGGHISRRRHVFDDGGAKTASLEVEIGEFVFKVVFVEIPNAVEVDDELAAFFVESFPL